MLLLVSSWTIQYQLVTVAFAVFLGIIGTLLIFVTEIGYTYRKTGLIQAGSVRVWLRTHIVMGIVGPVLILWHTGLIFYGFAGWLTGLTAVVVVSGFIGRYIYRLVPRSIKGQELSLKEIEGLTDALAVKLDELLAKSPEAADVIASIDRELGGAVTGGLPKDKAPTLAQLIKSSISWEISRLRLRSALAGRHPLEHGLLHDIKELELEQLTLRRRMNLLQASKTTLSKWNMFHKPLTLILFVGILLHVVNVLYYGKILP